MLSKTLRLCVFLCTVIPLATACTVWRDATNSDVEDIEIDQPTLTPTPSVIDTGLAYGFPCRPPCWQGLTPRISSVEETQAVVDHLLSSGVMRNVSIYDIQDKVIYRLNYPPHFSSSVDIAIILENDVVSEISGDIYFPYSAGMLIEQFGEPEGIYSHTPIPDEWLRCTSCDEWEYSPYQSQETLIFFYPNQGTLYYVAGYYLDGCICPEMPVVDFCYYEPHDYEDMFQNGCLYIECRTLVDATREEVIPWHGFGGGYAFPDSPCSDTE